MAVAAVGAVFTQETFQFAIGGFTTNNYSLNVGANHVTLHLHWFGPSEAPTTAFWNTTEQMTQIDSFVEGDDGFGVACYRLVNPTTGSHAFTINGLTVGTGGIVGAQGYSGVDTVTPVTGVTNHAGHVSTSPATLNTSAAAAADDLVIDAVTVNDGVVLTDDGGASTQLYQLDETTLGYCRGAASAETGTGTVTTAWTFTGTQAWAQINFILKATATGRVTHNTKSHPLGIRLGMGRGIGGS